MTNKALAIALWATYGLSFMGGVLYIDSDAYYSLVGLLMGAATIWAGIRLYRSK